MKIGSVLTVRVRSRNGLPFVATGDGVDRIGVGEQSDELAQRREGRIMGDRAVGLVTTRVEESMTFFLNDAFLFFPDPLPGV